MIGFKNSEEVLNKLKELRDNKLPHMTIEQFSKINEKFNKDIKEATDKELKAIEKRLNMFYGGVDRHACIFTNKTPAIDWLQAQDEVIDCNTGLTWVYCHYFSIKGEERIYKEVLQHHPSIYKIYGEDI